MEFNRNQYFFLGIVILLMGIQFRVVSSYVLTDDATHFLAERTRSMSSQSSVASIAGDLTGATREIRPPEWIGWCLISVGSVLILHSLAMRRPGS